MLLQIVAHCFTIKSISEEICTVMHGNLNLHEKHVYFYACCTKFFLTLKYIDKRKK